MSSYWPCKNIKNIKSFFAKSSTPNYFEKVFANKHVNTVPWTYVISDLKGEDNLGRFCKKEL